MINLFTIAALFVSIFFIGLNSGINYIKNPNKDLLKLGLIYSVGLFLINLYSHSYLSLLIGIFVCIFLFKNYSHKNLSFLVVITSISIVSSTYTNLGFIILSNSLITLTYFLLYSRLIFKNNTYQRTIKLDLLEYNQLQQSNQLTDKLSTFINGLLTKSSVKEIDTIREEVTIVVQYEQ